MEPSSCLYQCSTHGSLSYFLNKFNLVVYFRNFFRIDK